MADTKLLTPTKQRVPLHEAFRQIAGTYSLEEAMTSSEVGRLFLEEIETLFWSQYAMTPKVWDQLFANAPSSTPYSVYKTSKHFASLPKVPEGQEIPFTGRDVGVETVLKNDKYSALIEITEEMVKFDAIGEIRDVTSLFAETAARRPEELAMSVIETASNYAGSLTFALSLTQDNLATVYNALVSQKENGVPIPIIDPVLLVPPALQIAADQLVNSQLLIGFGGDTNTTIGNMNPLRSRLKVMVGHWLQDQESWYIIQPMRGLKMRTVEGPMFREYNPLQTGKFRDSFIYQTKWWGGVAVADNRFMAGSFV